MIFFVYVCVFLWNFFASCVILKTKINQHPLEKRGENPKKFYFINGKDSSTISPSIVFLCLCHIPAQSSLIYSTCFFSTDMFGTPAVTVKFISVTYCSSYCIEFASTSTSTHLICLLLVPLYLHHFYLHQHKHRIHRFKALFFLYCSLSFSPIFQSSHGSHPHQSATWFW